MCIALVAEAGKRPTKKALFSGWTANRDGGGFAYVNDGEVKIEKGFMVYNEFEKALEAALDTNEDSPFLIHMRIGTSGGKTPMNTCSSPRVSGKVRSMTARVILVLSARRSGRFSTTNPCCAASRC